MTGAKSSNSLVQRLRGLGDPREWASNHAVALCDEAADEIERLRHDIERHIAIASEHATENDRLQRKQHGLTRTQIESLQLDYRAHVSALKDAKAERDRLVKENEELKRQLNERS